jgi:hypothetical protein
MANKLTKEKIDLLIEQVMNEDISIGDIESQLKSKEKGVYDADNSPAKIKVASVANNDNNKDDITVDDIKTAFTDNNADQQDAIKFLDQGLPKNKTAYKQLQKDKQAAASELADAGTVDKVGTSKIKEKDIQDVIFNYDLKNASMQDGEPSLPPSLKNLFDILRLGSGTLPGRLEKLIDFSNNVIKAAEDENAAKQTLSDLGPLKFIQFTMAMDYISTIVKSVDAGSGAYMFETFLAALAGGNVTGKEKTAKGTMGGADFSFGKNSNIRGSAKYLKKGSAATQAVSGFEDDTTIHYVLAEKVLDKGQAKESSVDVDQIIALKIYYPVLQVVVPKQVFQFWDTNKQTIGKPIIQDSGSITIPRANHIGDLKLVSANGEMFREILEKSVEKIGGHIQSVFEQFQKAFDKVGNAKESVGSYSTTGKQADGNKAIKDMLEYKAALASVFETLKTIGDSDGEEDKPATGYEAPGEDQVKKLKENKTKSLKELDKLIEHVILNKMNK